MANFLAELKRRNIYRVGALYAVVAWVLLQLTANVAPILDLPPWMARAVLLLLVIGLPIALVFAWVQQLAPEGGAPARAATGKLDWALIGALVVVIALVSYQQLAPSRSPATASAQPDVEAERAAGTISIAVLPFANMSGDTGQEFFSDGMSEEITSALAKVQSLRVIGRTSAFQFKGEKKDLRAIGQALGAGYLIEGSVRKVADRVRITAQLVKADDGVNLWSQNYDRQITDIFATQEDIAQAIAAALRVPLGLRPGDVLVHNRTNVESYDQYLNAKAMVRARGLARMTDAAALLEQVVTRDPDFAPAWALLAQAYHFTPTYSPARDNSVIEDYRPLVNALLPKAEMAARRAIELDPELADGYLAMGYVQQVRGKWQAAEELYLKALALDANNPDALHLSGLLLAEVGRVKDALVMRQKLHAQEPFVPVFNVITGLVFWLNEQNDAAIAVLKGLPPGARSETPLAMIAAQTGRYNEAADTLLTIPPGLYLPGRVEESARLLRTAPALAAAPESLSRLGNLGFVFLYVGAPSRVLEFYESNAEAGFLLGGITSPLWHPSYAAVRKSERFKAYARKAGLVDYWRARGWPDLCRPMGADNFVCD